MGFKDWFKRTAQTLKEFSRWREYGVYLAQFSAFGNNAYASDTVRACIRAIASHTSKANARCTDKQIERILNYRPNMYMTGRDFLEKVRIWLELKNTVFILIHRDDKGHCDGLYPIPYQSWDALEYKGRLFIKFEFRSAPYVRDPIVVAWEDLAVIRQDYNASDIAGDSNSALMPRLETSNTINQGMQNAIKSTANLRGILKSTKAMLAPEAIKAQKDQFVKDYLSLENEGGIASLDSTQEFIPITMTPVIASWESQKETRENIYRYYGVSDHIVMSSYTESEMEAFYDARIEPFLVALSTELTSKCFTWREIAFGASITYEASRLQFSSTKTKLAMVALVDRALMTPNEYRMIFGMAPYDGGDEFVMRLDTDKTGNTNGDSAPADDEKEDDDGSEG